MFYYAVSRPYPSPLSGFEPIDNIPKDVLRLKSRLKAITDAFLTGGVLVFTEENAEHIRNLESEKYLKIGSGGTLIQAMERCLNTCVFEEIDDYPLLSRIHIWSYHRCAAKSLFPKIFEKPSFSFSDFREQYPEITDEDAVELICGMLKNNVITITEIN